MLKDVFCSCGIVKFSDQQCSELKRTDEKHVTQKLGLGDSFPRAFSYIRKNALEEGLTEPQTAINLLALKLHSGKKISGNQSSTIINTHEYKSH